MESHVPDPNDPIYQSPPPADHRLSINQSPTKDLNESISQTNPQLNQSVTNAGPASKSLLVQPGAGPQGQMLNRPELRLENQINFMIALISFLTVLIIWWNLIFVEAFCLLRFACVPDGVETPMFVMKSMFVIFFFVLIFAPTIYYVVRHGDKSGVRCFKWINWLLIIAMIILFIVSFAKMGKFGTDDVVDKWSQLSTNDRLQQYDDNIGNLVDVNKKNLLLHAIYNIVLTVLFVVISIALYNYDFILPERWSSDRARKSRVSFAEDSLIVVSKNKPDLQAERVRTDQRSRALDMPQIDEERHSLVGDSHIPQVNLFKPTSTYDNYPVRDRTFASPDPQNRREFDDPSFRSPGSGYGSGQADRNYPRSPQELTRGGYGNEDLRTRDQRDLNRGENHPVTEIEMATSNYVGNLTRKKRTLGE